MTSSAAPGVTWNRAFALLVALAGFMELFDGTVIQTALPALGRDLGVDVATTSVTMASYFAAAAGVVPLCAWLTERLGVRTAFTAGILVFAGASLICGSTDSLPWLVAFRILQGVGGAVMMAVGQIAILRDAPKDKLLNITAYLVWPALAAPVVAPVVGGLITDSIGWRWLFWINVPIGIVAAIASVKLAPGRLPVSQPRRLDWIGATLLALGLCTLVPALGLVEAGAAPGRLTAIGIGLAFCVAAVVWLLRAKHPLLDLRVYEFATFRSSNGAGAIYRAMVSAMPVILTLLFQTGFGWSATAAGASVMVLFAGNLSIKPFANYSARRWGYRNVLITHTLLGAAVMIAFAFVDRNTGWWVLVPLLYVSGAARSIGFTSYMSMQYSEVPKDRMAFASPLSGVVHQVATALGIALTVGLLVLLQAVPSLVPGSAGSASRPAFRWTLLTMGVLLAASVVFVLRLPKDAGQVALSTPVITESDSLEQ